MRVMRTRLRILLAVIGLLAALNGCTSNNSSEDLDTGEGDLATDESQASSDGSALAADTIPEDTLAADPSQPSGDDLGLGGLSDAPLDGSSASASPPSDSAAASGTEVAQANPPAEPITSDAITETPPPPAETSTASSLTDLDKMEQPKTEDAPKKTASLQKMADAPWKVGKDWVNGIYFVRPGDSLESISQLIYGTSKVKDLKKINPTYKNRDVKPGDKVYYSSPKRPDDSVKMMTYFEDQGIPSKVYVTQDGDNIRKLSKKLLGYPEAWKEVWSYNSVESKGSLDAGVELRYWDSEGARAAPPMNELASNNTSPMPEMAPPPVEASLPPPVQEMTPPPMEMAPPPPPPMPEASLPPPPPPMEMAPPPPPPPPSRPPQEEVAAEGGGMMGEDPTMMIGIGVIALAALVGLIVIRKKRRQRELEQAINETQVGT